MTSNLRKEHDSCQQSNIAAGPVSQILEPWMGLMNLLSLTPTLSRWEGKRH